MKINESVKSTAAVLTQVAVPVLMVLGVRTMTLDGGPAKVSAAGTTEVVAETPAPKTVDLSLDEKAARQLAEAAKVRAGVIERDPFVSKAFGGDPSTVPMINIPHWTKQDDSDSAPKPIEAPQLRLTSIASGRETVAVIGGRICRVSEAVAPEWILKEIDAVANTVTIEHVTGKTAVISLSR